MPERIPGTVVDPMPEAQRSVIPIFSVSDPGIQIVADPVMDLRVPVVVSGGVSSFPYPGDDATVSPGEGYEWRGRGEPGSGMGSWYNPSTGVSLYPDLRHALPIGPHWDHIDADGIKSRIMPDGTRILKNPVDGDRISDE